MNFNKYFAFLAFLVLCLLGQQAAEAHRFGHFGHELSKGFKKVDKVVGHINTAKKVIEVGSVVAGVVAEA